MMDQFFYKFQRFFFSFFIWNINKRDMKRDIFIFGEDGEIDGVVCIFFLIVKVFSELFVDDNVDCLIIN